MSVDTTDDVDTQEPRNTVPTGQELAARLDKEPDAVRMIGGRRDGSMFCQIFRLSDGFAYRPWGTESSDSWEWLRTEDFERAFFALELVDMQAVEEVMHELVIKAVTWRSRFQDAVKAMGGKSRKRLGKKIFNAYTDR